MQELQKPEFSWLFEDSQVEKSIFVMMSASSHHLHHLEDIQILRTQFQQKFPDEPLLADIFFYEALTLAYHQKYEDAIKTLETLLLNIPREPFERKRGF